MIPRVRKALVLGGGSAGFLAAISCKTIVPDVEVELLRSPDIGIIGVGEGTTPTIPTLLHGVLNMDLAEFYRVANPSFKLGIHYLWGPRPHFNYTFRHQCDTQYLKLSRPTGYYCKDNFEHADQSSSLMDAGRCCLRRPDGFPIIDRDLSYHLENETFVKFMEGHARRIGVAIRDDKVIDVKQNDAGIAGLVLEKAGEIGADLYIDCSGFRSVLLGEALKEPFLSFKKSLFCDRAVVGGWTRSKEPVLPYTIAETMNAGWCWQIEHEHRINRGYVFSSAFLSDEQAMEEFRAKNPKLGPMRVVKFISGRYRDSWVKNVAAVGNSSGFVEPLESTSLAAIAIESQAIAENLRDSPDRSVSASRIRTFNTRAARNWDTIRDFLAIHYRFNRRLDTPFWRACLADVDLCGAAHIVEYYQENGPSIMWRDTLLDRCDQFKMDGHWTMLVGQQVPYQCSYVPSEGERAVFRSIQEANRRRAAAGMTVAEALAMVRRPEWTWSNQFYREAPTIAISGLNVM
jgi:tryptophan halogenase